jgi:hypothetical protein
MAEPEPREPTGSFRTPRPGRVSSLSNRIQAVHSPQAAQTDAEQVRAGELTCQWCSVTLAPGVTICPTCGSPGVPDAALSLPAAALLEEESFIVVEKPPEELVEWWHDEDELDEDGSHRFRNSAALQEPDPLVTAAVLGGSVLIGILLGVLAAPLLAPLMENLTGVEVENVNDLRPMGGIIGLLTGLTVGAVAGWVMQPSR